MMMRICKVLALLLLAALAMTAPASAQTVIVPAHHHHARTHHRGYLYVAEARLRAKQTISTKAPAGFYTIGACRRRSSLAVDCAVQRAFTEQQTATICDYVSRVRKYVRADGSYHWRAALRPGGHGCRLA